MGAGLIVGALHWLKTYRPTGITHFQKLRMCVTGGPICKH